MPLKKTHLEHLVGLPEKDAVQIADRASRNNWSADEVTEQANDVRERIEDEKRQAEAMSHFTMKECPICGAPGMLVKEMRAMRCSAHYNHFELGLRHPLLWGPLDTKEDFLKRKFKLDDGRSLPLEDIMKISRKARAVPKRKPDWFKHEAPLDKLMPKINAFAYEMLLANNPTISKIDVSGKTKDGADFHLDTTERGISVRIGGRSLYIWFEGKKWKRGNFKTRVNVQGVDEPEKLKLIQIFLDKLMQDGAKVEDYPFDARVKRLVQAPSPDETDNDARLKAPEDLDDPDIEDEEGEEK